MPLTIFKAIPPAILGLSCFLSSVSCLLFLKNKKMVKPNIYLMPTVMLMILAVVDSHASVTEAPTPQPQRKGKLPMYGTTQGSLQPQECAPRCTARCSETAYKKPCMFFCQKCCAKCLCVPAGTYGNKQSCPCYNNWKTKRGGPKCP